MTTVDTAPEEAEMAAPAPAKVISVGRPKHDPRTNRWRLTVVAYIEANPVRDLHTATIERDTEDEARARIADVVEALSKLVPWGNDADVETRLP